MSFSLVILTNEISPSLSRKIFSLKRIYSTKPIIITTSNKTLKKLSYLNPILTTNTHAIKTLKDSQFKLEENVIIAVPSMPQHLQATEKLIKMCKDDIKNEIYHPIGKPDTHSILMRRDTFIHLISSFAYIDDLKLLIPQLELFAKKEGYKDKSVNYRELPANKASFIDKAVMMLHLSIQKPNPFFAVPESGTMKGSYVKFKNKEFITHTSLTWTESALQILRRYHIITTCFILLFLSILLDLTNIKVVAISFVCAITLSYFIDLLYNAILIGIKFKKSREVKINAYDINEYEKANKWPTYTVFCPLYKEINVVPQFVKAMRELDYPNDKLKIVFLLEEDDLETKEGIENMLLPKHFQINIVPHSLPKTKPKAVNWGLAHAKSDYIVIYDAEDIPEPDQLKKAIVGFEKENDPSLICLQAKLNFYNPRQNLLTRMFVGEYSLWFDFILPGLQTVGSPIPLGGTSNHFKRELLESLKGWDPFNVTEDCDLGVRIFTHAFKTQILDSTTWEEANSNVRNWLRQRSRWIKGYMQTFFVHSTRPKAFNSIHYISFLLVVGGKVATLFINPFLWFMTVGYFILRPLIGKTVDSFFPPPIFYLGMVCLVFGNFLYLYSFVIGLAKREYWDLIKYAIFVPFYWLLMSVSAWIALYQLIFKPYFWEKTKHGLHLKEPEKQEEFQFDIFTSHETNQI